MAKTHMIFSESLDGHLLEYLHHIYMYASRHFDNFIFVCPEDFKYKKNYLKWPLVQNIRFIYLSEDDRIRCSTSNFIRRSWGYTRVLTRYIKKENPYSVFLLNLILPMPFLGLFLSRETRISGVIYKIYLYDKSRYFYRVLIDRFLYLLLAKHPLFENIYLLNSTESVTILNRVYKTEHFKYLPDPIPYIDESVLKNIREMYNIPSSNIVYLQYGSLDSRKNTIPILKAISMMSDIEISNRTFIFSGKLKDEIKDEFKQLVSELKNRVQIIVIEGFVAYELLNNLCFSSDYILTIYNNTSQSSGTIGYSAYMNKVVIGPSGGLLGELIKKYHLGITINAPTPEHIKSAMLTSYITDSKEYCLSHQIDDFISSISVSFK